MKPVFFLLFCPLSLWSQILADLNFTGELLVEFSNVHCMDNGTILDTSDDYIVFDLLVQEDQLSNGFTIVSDNGWVSPDVGTYGEADTYIMHPGSAGGGNLTLTISDYVYPLDYFVEYLLDDPGSCSDANPAIYAEVLDINCQFNGTIDDTDDFVEIYLVVTTDDLEGFYSLSTDVGEIIPFEGSYNDPLYFAFEPGSAGMGDRLVTLADVKYPDIFIEVLIEDPGTCSTVLQEMTIEILDVGCTDNDTPLDGTDDGILVELLVMSNIPSYGYDIFPGTGLIDPFMGVYDQTLYLTMEPGSAGNGDRWLYLSDIDDPGVMDSVLIIDPGPCSFTSVHEDAASSGFSCYPNPATQDMVIKLNNDQYSENVALDIFSPDGSLLATYDLDGSRTLIIQNPGYSGLSILILHNKISGQQLGWESVLWE
ncbi:MAG: hypothetical protein KDC34_04565 [Saprospiraceae bacterium]|nr:hypothetical protein [Saprospiraceae bacterium]